MHFSISLIFLATVKGSGYELFNALNDIKQFCGSYYTLADNVEDLRSRLLGILAKLDAANTIVDPSDHWNSHLDGIHKFLDDIDDQLDMGRGLATSRDQIMDCNVHRQCAVVMEPSGSEAASADQVGQDIELIMSAQLIDEDQGTLPAEELVEAPAQESTDETPQQLLVEGSHRETGEDAVSLTVGAVSMDEQAELTISFEEEVIVRPPEVAVGQPAAAESEEVRVYETESPTLVVQSAAGSELLITQEETAPAVQEVPTPLAADQEQQGPAPKGSAPTALAQTAAKARALLDTPLAFADQQLLADLVAVLAGFQKKGGKLRANHVKTKSAVVGRIEEVKAALERRRKLDVWRGQVTAVEEKIATVFADVFEAGQVTTGDFRLMQNCISELETVLTRSRAHVEEFMRFELPIVALVQKTDMLLEEIVHLRGFEQKTMEASFFVPFSALGSLVGRPLAPVDAVEIEFFNTPVMTALGEQMSESNLQQTVKHLQDWAKLIKAHLEGNVVLEEGYRRGVRKSNVIISMKLTSLQYYLQIIKGIDISYGAALKAILALLEAGRQTFIQKSTDRATVTLLKHKVLSAYAVLLNHPDTPTDKELAETRAVLDYAGVAIGAMNQSGIDSLSEEIVTVINDLQEAIIDTRAADILLNNPSTDKEKTLAEFETLWLKAKLLSYHACAFTQGKRTLFITKLTQARANVHRARVSLAARQP